MKTKQKRIVGLVSFLAASNASAVYRRESCLSVCLSVRLLKACIVTKRKKDLSRFLYYTKDYLF